MLYFNNINPLNIYKRMIKKQQLFLDIPGTSIGLTQNFPQDPAGDFTIKFKSKSYRLQKSILKQYSHQLQKIIETNADLFQVKASFDETAFDNIISLMYGNTIGIDRSQIVQYFQIVKFLGIQSLIQTILADVQQYFKEYDTFVILKLAFDYKLEQLQKLCMQELQKQQFEQLKYHQLSLLNMDISIFKKIIKLHNSFKKQKKKGVSSKTINQIVKLYSQANNIRDYKYDQLKAELIEVSYLTSHQYSQLFLKPIINKIQKISKSQSSDELDTKFKKDFRCFLGILNKIQKKQESAQQQLYNVTEIKSYVENIYLKKKISQLQKQLAHIQSEYQKHSMSPDGKNEFDTLSKNSRKSFNDQKNRKARKMNWFKQYAEQNSKEQILKIFNVIDKMNTQFELKIEEMNKIVSNYEQSKAKLQKNGEYSFNPKKINSLLNSTQIHYMMVNDKADIVPIPRKKKQEFIRSKANSYKTAQSCDYNKRLCQSLSQASTNRIQFDIKSECVSSADAINLNSLLIEDGFKKKIFKLLFRRSQKCQNKGQIDHLFNRNGLLILIKTKAGQKIGGYLSTRLIQQKFEYEDKNSFIFNIDKMKKYKIQNQQNPLKTLKLSAKNMIQFSNSLKIARECLKQKSQVTWPVSSASYLEMNESGKNLQSITTKESIFSRSFSIHNLVYPLAYQFQVEVLQIYQVKQQEMEMVI